MYNHTMNYKLSLIPTGILHVNTWFFFKDNSLYLIDPGGDPDKIIPHIEKEWENYLKKSHLEQKNIFILLTHCHFDHISAIPELLDYFPKARLFAHEKDAEVLGKGSRERIIMQARWCGIENYKDFLQKDIPFPELLTGESKIGPFKVIHTPGHTPIFRRYSFLRQLWQNRFSRRKRNRNGRKPEKTVYTSKENPGTSRTRGIHHH